MSIPCNSYVVPIFENDPCNGNRVGAGCVVDSSLYSELGLSSDSTQQEINQAIYLAYLNLKATTDNIDATVSGLDGSETKVEAGDNVEITGTGTTVNPYIVNAEIDPVSATVSGIVNNVSLQELGGVDKLVNSLRVGKGEGDFNLTNTALGIDVLGLNAAGDFNTGLGWESLKSNTDGYYNTAIGASTLASNTTGENNTTIGADSLSSNTTGASNTVVGSEAMISNTIGGRNSSVGTSSLSNSVDGYDNTALGHNAGTYATDGVTAITSINNSVLIGAETRPLGNTQTNQIVIGKGAIGAGTNTATLGNTSITTTRLRGSVLGGFFVKDGGTSSEFLKADGSVDATNYQQDLQSVLDTGSTSFKESSILNLLAGTANDRLIYASMDNGVIGVGKNATSFSLRNSRLYIINLKDADKQARIYVDSGEVHLTREKGGFVSDFNLKEPTVNTGIALPAKTIPGNYTVNTTPDVTYTVSTLPAGVLNDMAIVTDATAPTYLGALTGGGAVVCPVWYNGTIWVSR